MLTLKFKIKSVSNEQLLDDYIRQYTGLYYKLYNNAELLEDKTFAKEMLSQFSLFDKSMYDFCIQDVKGRLEQFETQKKKEGEQIEEIKYELENKKFVTKKELRLKFKLKNKLNSLQKSVKTNICFGGKNLLREITKQAQSGNVELKEKYLIQFRQKRKLGVYLVGRACEKGNRKIEFKLDENKIIFCPNRKTDIEIEFNSSKKQNETLFKLQQYAMSYSIPITVRIDNNFVYLAYNEELLSGFSFDETGYLSFLKKNEIKDKEKRKEIYKEFKNEQLKRKFKNKIANRFMSVDLNPKEIGLIIGDKINDGGEYKVIYKELISLDNLSNKLSFSSFDKGQLYQNNKRKHEIKEVWNHVFKLAKHYKVAWFVMEDLEFKPKQTDTKSKESNRQTKNMWHRTLTTNLIKKWCNILGLEKVEVNPCYSSFIGNMIHPDYDPISSAREILRRGIIKYVKGSSLYPSLTKINQEKLVYLLGENVVDEKAPTKKVESWIQLYRLLAQGDAKLRYRNKSKLDLEAQKLKHHASGVFICK
jgi:IS605 OrfB family transposase